MRILKPVFLILAILGMNILTNVNVHGQNIGTCTAPYATLTVFSNFAAADAAYTTQQQSWSPDATGTVSTYARINSGPDGKVGFDLSHQVGSSASTGCVGNAQREIRLFLESAGACNWATGITYSVADGGNGASWSNPEFYGLTPNTNYIVQVKTIIPSAGSCAVQSQYLTYYQIVSPVTCSTCANPSCPVTSITATTVAAARTNMTTALAPFTDSYSTTLSPGQSQTICVQVTVPAGSTVLGFKQKASSSPSGCANATEEPVTYQLRPAGNCAATPIAPSLTNASPVSSGFNPEWNNLAAGNYILCYTMSVSASAGCSDVTIDRIGYYNVVPVVPPCTSPTITAQPVSKSLCAGENTSFSVTATGATGYQWIVNSGSGWSNVVNGGVYSGATTATLTINGASVSMNSTQYQCIVRESTNGCPDTTATAIITVVGALAPVYTKTSTDVTCAGPNTGSITFSGISANTTFNWVSGPLTSPIPAANKPAGATDERALINIPTGTYCADITRTTTTTTTQTLFTEEFETGAPNWTIDNTGGSNIFLINNNYLGGSCVSGAGTFTVPVVPNQPAAVPGFPTSNYLHIMATTTTGATCGSGSSTPFPPLNANFDGVTSNQEVTLNVPIVTTSLTNVTFSFYWLGKGDASGNDYGAIEYSTNGGTTWTQVGAKLFNQTTWTLGSRTDASWSNLANLRFRIVWRNNTSSSIDPPLAIDHIVITGDATTACDSTVTECVTISSPPSSVTPTFTQIAPICEGATAPVLPTSSNNTPAITGTWNAAINTTTAGTTIYTFTPTAGQCASTATMNVVVNQRVTPTFTAIAPICVGATPVSLATTSINGITGTWTPTTISTAAAGTTTYAFTSTAGLCANNTTLPVVIASSPIALLTADSVACFGESNGSIIMTVSDGVPTYSYVWNNGSFNEDLVNVPAGHYAVLVTDANNCTVSASADVFQPVALSVTVDGTEVLCKNEQTGFVNVTVNSGTSPYSYLWSNGAVTSTINSLMANNYSVIITDGNGCTYSANHLIQTSMGPDANASVYYASDNPAEAHFMDGSTDAYTWSWSFGDGDFTNVQNPVHVYPQEGEYLVGLGVIDANGCIDSTTIKVVVNPDFQIWIPNAFTPDSDHNNATFKPKARGCKTEGYSMLIFDRWGEMIFESNEIETGWDGLYKNEGKMGELIFVYKITIVDLRGKKHQYVGQIAKIGDNIKR
jgi:gliding motility-associated-like protein